MTETEAAKMFAGGRRRVAKGPPRPTYLRGEDHDRVLFTLVNVLGEISVLRDRLDTHEALAAQGIMPTQAAVEAFEADESRSQARSDERTRTLQRVFRVILEDYEAQVTLGKQPDLSHVIPKQGVAF